eukprot:Platyproteum_vivax@DN3325_c0_g1_i1.p1
MADQKPTVWQALRSGPLRVSVIGSGNWGTAICKLIGENAQRSFIFADEVKTWVFEEEFQGRKLTEIINTDHENKKYLPGIKLPPNVKAIPSVKEAAKDTDLYVFVLPHQFLKRTLAEMKSVVAPHAKAISLIKGFEVVDGSPVLMTDVVEQVLGIECSALSGANVAKDVALEQFSESTVGYKAIESAAIWQQVFDSPYFKVNAVPDVAGTQVCGAIKNVVALAGGFIDGLKLGTNAKSAIMRLGFEEMRIFAVMFFNGILEDTFFDSAGLADLITTCFGGRNVKCATAFIEGGGKKTWETIEAELLGGQKLQGTLTAKEVYEVLGHHNIKPYFPLFCTTYQIAYEGRDPKDIINVFQTQTTRPIKNPQYCTSSVLDPRIPKPGHKSG